MNRYLLITAILLVPISVHASQTLFSVQLKSDDVVTFTQAGEMVIQQRESYKHIDFDFALILGNCPTVCGAKCPLDILSKSEIFVYKTSPETFPLFDQVIDLSSSEFNTSSDYQNFDSLKFYTVPTEKFHKYYIFKTVLNKYALLIIDSLKLHDACTYPVPCCNATTIECVYGRILYQPNGQPEFDIPVPVEAKTKLPINLKAPQTTTRAVDIQGRAISDNTRATAGVRLIVKKDDITVRIVVQER